MSEKEYIAGLQNTIFDACDGDRPDNFARKLTAEQLEKMYEEIVGGGME